MISLDKPIHAGVGIQQAAQQPAGMSLRRQASHVLYREVKRLFDIAGALVGCIVVLAVCPAIWLANRLRSPGDLFYWQERVGLHGRPFRMVKFRSMIMNAEADTGPIWAQDNDCRITEVGCVLRKSRLDELPQVWNVLRGEMSLIGPRPERPEFVASLAESLPTFQERHAVKPGITGWAQVNYRYVASVDDTLVKLQYDLYYIEHRSIYLDLLILAKTVLVMASFKGT